MIEARHGTIELVLERPSTNSVRSTIRDEAKVLITNSGRTFDEAPRRPFARLIYREFGPDRNGARIAGAHSTGCHALDRHRPKRLD